MTTIISFLILIFSIILHEIAHGYMANYLGDPTARLQGRLTLNPLKHIDPIGSIVVPIITSLSGFTFGWAKPVEYNPYNLKNRRLGELLIALAGPGSNLIIALVFGTIIRYTFVNSGPSPFIEMSIYIVMINLGLAIFNLIPLPPLDGSKILFYFLKDQFCKLRIVLESYAPIFILIVVFALWKIISPLVLIMFGIITGINI